jgi:hypothetical protein
MDISGRLIYAVEKNNLSPGIHHEIIDREDLGKNTICILKVQTTTQSYTQKLIIMD